ncbi:tRNA(Met) cytidine acetyltransferase TmcA [Halomonas binhaiensis]|uniref:tRNA(Met) cytidine acetyltransferase TmcA n=1 Tax=Halomonas binhaiensis TaxID=2562282 RepID=A0A5C1NB50_9GAMM|nr:GNAT family N-acetyltransferase [Halomonas binhaiensis]QEM80384.1 tRNA(Met) cytidine acetyltransferase [Halomonas binhaiensis]
MSQSSSSFEISRLESWRHSLSERRWRGLVWVTGAVGEADACVAGVRDWWLQGNWQAPLWVGGVAACTSESTELRSSQSIDPRSRLSPAKARTRLGSEHDLIVIDALSPGHGLDPDALGALAGTLVAGGILVLLTADDGGARPDADYARLAAHPWTLEQMTSRYLRRFHSRLAELVQQLPGIACWRPGQSLEWQDIPAGSITQPEPVQDAECLTLDQAKAVDSLIRLKRRRPFVLTADRGRGKSSALGIACSRLLEKAAARHEVLDIVLTAPRPDAVAPVFERLAALCPQGERSANEFEAPGGSVRFMAPDALSAMVAGGGKSFGRQESNTGRHSHGDMRTQRRLLLVDEAAAIPAAMLAEWLLAFPRIAFSTTEHGYEGSGRGFALRFRRRLDELTPQWRSLHLKTPVRWAQGDPLEIATSRLLLLDAEPGDITGDGAASRLGRLPICLLDPDQLMTDEVALARLFGLLVQAHYRTTPADLRALLDAPGGHLMLLGEPDTPAGVIVSQDEGSFDAELADAVARGERRPRGHLLAQSLAVHAGEREALIARVRRISRIAVHPEMRRQGGGSRLLEAARKQAEHDGVDLLGASFGADPELLSFWLSQGYRIVRLGLTREAATGEHAVMVVHPCSEHGRMLVERLAQRFQCQLPGLLAFELCTLSPALVAILLEAVARRAAAGETQSGDPWAYISTTHRQDLEDVVAGGREPALVRPAIQSLVTAAAGAGCLATVDAQWLAAWAFQGRDEAALAHALSLTGRAQVKQWRRSTVAELLDGLGSLSKRYQQG